MPKVYTKGRVAGAKAGPKPSKASPDHEALTPPPEDGLRLLKAFMRIRDPALRTKLIEQAEAMARRQ